MNIIFVSCLLGQSHSGLDTSVPRTIMYQEMVDSCLWVEANNIDLQNFHSIQAFNRMPATGLHLASFPQPFDKPDLVVFFGVYFLKYLLFANELKAQHIPYVIRPASSLTYQAQHNNAFLKKKIANLLLFNHFIKGANAIHYLTEEEKRDSGPKWNKHSFVLPNGITMPESRKATFSQIGIKAVSIGRIDIYHKGIDLLLKAIRRNQNTLRGASFSLKIFGPINKDAKKVSRMIAKYGINDIVSLCGEVSGAEKESAFLDSDLFILTSRFEGHPIALLEALSYGLPVAISPGTNMKQKVQQYDAGWCCGETTINSISNMLLTIIEERNSFASKGKQSIELAKTYNYSQIAEQFHGIAQGIVNNNYL